MKGFPEEVRREVLDAQNWRCGIEGCPNRAEQCHHRVHNTATNRKLYPNFIHSPFNCIALCSACHDSGVISTLDFSYKQAALYEKWTTR